MRVVIAGGGTGGHLYPGIAIAEEVIRRRGEVLFVGTSRGLEARVVPAAGYSLELLEVSGLKRMGPWAMARGLARVPPALARSWGILRRFRPDVVLGVGGYASGPVVLAAALGRLPTAIQEQNSVPGFTNRMLGRFARAVFIAFEEARAHFKADKIHLTGNPVRRRFLNAVAATGPRRRGRGLLVVGGSQGARAVNDLVIGVVEILAKRGSLPPIVHQTGPSDLDRCKERYAALGAAVDARPFIEDMVTAYADAALVIGRAGALTLAELAVLGRPAVLVPLPTATDDHQRRNAEAFAAAGAAVLVDQKSASAAALADLVQGLLADERRLEGMATAMAALGRPSAAAAIVDQLEALAR